MTDTVDIKCVVCDGDMGSITREEADLHGPAWCLFCNERYPPSLIKAHHDPFSYALGLRSGEIIRFSEADIDGEWVHITGPFALLPDMPCPRGLDVRVSDIVWCCAAPDGS